MYQTRMKCFLGSISVFFVLGPELGSIEVEGALFGIELDGLVVLGPELGSIEVEGALLGLEPGRNEVVQ